MYIARSVVVKFVDSGIKLQVESPTKARFYSIR